MSDRDESKVGSTALVACGVLRQEIERLREQGRLGFDEVYFTAPGLHDNPKELDRQLRKRLDEALQRHGQAVVGFGSRCVLDPAHPERTVDGILARYGDRVRRLGSGNCVEFLADEATRAEIAAGRTVYWLTPGWLRYHKAVFRYFDETHKNEAFGRCDTAVLLCPLGTFDDIAVNEPEKILELSDWMGLDIEPAPVDLGRFDGLLQQAREALKGGEI